jgi:hypothetical protein
MTPGLLELRHAGDPRRASIATPFSASRELCLGSAYPGSPKARQNQFHMELVATFVRNTQMMEEIDRDVAIVAESRRMLRRLDYSLFSDIIDLREAITGARKLCLVVAVSHTWTMLDSCSRNGNVPTLDDSRPWIQMTNCATSWGNSAADGWRTLRTNLLPSFGHRNGGKRSLSSNS